MAKHDLPLAGAHYAKLPRGFATDDPDIEHLLKFNALHAAYHLPHPKQLATPLFVDFCIDKWKNALPLHEWLVRMDG